MRADRLTSGNIKACVATPAMVTKTLWISDLDTFNVFKDRIQAGHRIENGAYYIRYHRNGEWEPWSQLLDGEEEVERLKQEYEEALKNKGAQDEKGV